MNHRKRVWEVCRNWSRVNIRYAWLFSYSFGALLGTVYNNISEDAFLLISSPDFSEAKSAPIFGICSLSLLSPNYDKRLPPQSTHATRGDCGSMICRGSVVMANLWSLSLGLSSLLGLSLSFLPGRSDSI